MTFSFVNVCWVFFRAKTLPDAVAVLKGMVGLHGVVLPGVLAGRLSFLRVHGIKFSDQYLGTVLGNQEGAQAMTVFPMIAVFLLVCVWARNSDELTERYVPRAWTWVLAAVLFAVSILSMSKVTSFLYFNF